MKLKHLKNGIIDFKKQNMKTLTLNEQSILKANKADLNDFASNYIQRVKDGYLEPAEALIMANKAVKLFKVIDDNIRPIVLSKLDGNKYESFNTSIEKANAPSTYDYSVCNDDELNDLTSKLELIKKQISERQNFLKSLSKPVDLLNKDTGEICTINPPIKLTSETIKVSVK